jgi:homoserine kinase
MRVFAPISIGNLSVGFDTLGLAIAPIDQSLLGDQVEVEFNHKKSNQFNLTGSYADRLSPNQEDNIAWTSLQYFNQALLSKNIQPQSLDLTLFKNIPVSSGLGSSSCSVVATLKALNLLYTQSSDTPPLSNTELLKLMGAIEGAANDNVHYDNVAPSFLGGLQLILSHNESIIHNISQTLPFFDEVYWLIAYPDMIINTKQAREILPKQYPKQTVIEFGQNLASFVDACYRKDKVQAFNCIKDVLAEPYRKDMLPKFEQTKEMMLQMDCLAMGISGSGPTIFAAFDNLNQAEKAKLWLEQHYIQTNNGFAVICQADSVGARTLTA